MVDILLSYNREDQAVTCRFAEGFEREGFGVWWGLTDRQQTLVPATIDLCGRSITFELTQTADLTH